MINGVGVDILEKKEFLRFIKNMERDFKKEFWEIQRLKPLRVKV